MFAVPSLVMADADSPLTKRRHGGDGGFVIPKKRRLDEAGEAGAAETQPPAEDSDEITKVKTGNQVGTYFDTAHMLHTIVFR